MVSTTDFIAAIEIGSLKIAGIVGKKNSDGSIQVLAYANEESSSFIKKGAVLNLDKTAQSLTSIINTLEGSIDGSIGKVYVGISGQSLRTVKHTVMRSLKEETVISQELIDSICDENREKLSDDMVILDVVPQEYRVGNTLLVEPVGVPANHIEGRYMNIVARSALKKNLERCFDAANIEIAEILISPVVTAQAVLAESEMRSGCCLVDFGADTTTVSVYKGNILRFLTVIPLGGNCITRDITSLHMEEYEAEKLKVKYGSVCYEEDSTEANSVQTEDSLTVIDLCVLNDIVEARAEEIILNVWNQIELSGYADKLLSGIIITGGGSNLKHIDDLIRNKGMIDKIRIANAPRYEVRGGVVLNDGTQNTLFGLISAGKENCHTSRTVEAKGPFKEDMFADDVDLIQQEEAARIEKERKEREERERKERERQAKKEAKKKGPSKFQSLIEKFSKEIFDDDKM